MNLIYLKLSKIIIFTYHGALNNTHTKYINDKNINVEIEDANEKEMFKSG